MAREGESEEVVVSSQWLVVSWITFSGALFHCETSSLGAQASRLHRRIARSEPGNNRSAIGAKCQNPEFWRWFLSQAGRRDACAPSEEGPPWNSGVTKGIV